MATTTGQLNDTSERSKTDAGSAVRSLGDLNPAMESVDHFVWHPADSAVSIDVHPDVMDGIARDVLESLDALPPRGAEVGGLLLGSVDQTPDRTSIRIERYHRIPCAHATGPEFILDPADRAGLENAATSILDASRLDGSHLSAVGVYRSHMRPGLQLEDSDLDLIERYFQEPFDIVLLIKPDTAREMTGQFFVRDHQGHSNTGMQPLGSTFPYRVAQARTFAPPTIRSRRLVPDFIPDIVAPVQRDELPLKVEAPSFGLPDPNPFDPRPSTPDHESNGPDWKKWWPLPASLLVAGAMLWLLLAPPARHSAPASPAAAGKTEQKAELDRPLGLYAATAGQSWRVSWNPNATALHNARSVQLFVREGGDQRADQSADQSANQSADQNRIDLSPRDLASGTYNYKPAGNDVTFRLEVTDSSGRISADSFHFVREIPPPAKPTIATTIPPALPAAQTVPPKAIHKVPPSIPASIRPRIKSVIPIDVHVKVDNRGRVASATLPGKHRPGLESYLAERAVEAAKQWRFEPAREDGKAVAGEQTLRFTFGK